MAVHQNTPMCPYCGKATAKPILRTDGDHFIGNQILGWAPIQHFCMEKAKHLHGIGTDLKIIKKDV